MSTRARAVFSLALSLAIILAASGFRPEAPVCSTRQDGSRWHPSATRRYQAKGDYGRAGNGSFTDVQSVAVMHDTVYANDPNGGAIIVLRPDLKLIRRIERGAHAQDPVAEMMMSGSIRRRFFDVSDSALYVYDGKLVAALSHAGAPLGDTRLVPPGFASFSVIGIQVLGSDLLFAVDSTDPSAGKRHFQIWITPLKGGATKRIPLDLQLRPPQGRVLFVSANQPHPLSAAGSHCVVASDGENEWVLRYRMDGRGADTVRLPHLDVKASKDVADGESHASALLDALQGLKGTNANAAGPSGGAMGVLRWTDMIIDPDGYLWIELRGNAADDKATVRVYRVDLASGEVEKDVLPAFPVAFGEPGSYYARATDPGGAIYLARYELAPAR